MAVEGASYFFGFDNMTGGTLSQVLSTITGGTYNISVSFNTNGSVPPNALNLGVGNLSTALSLQESTWNSFSSNFTASSTLSTLDFGFLTVGGTGTVFIDNIDVEWVGSPVPEPSSVALVGLALFALSRSLRARSSP